jgi:hypothetical protein
MLLVDSRGLRGGTRKERTCLVMSSSITSHGLACIITIMIVVVTIITIFLQETQDLAVSFGK